MARRRARGFTLWLALVVSLASALLPLGPPASRTNGSAFSPATTSVAIKARAAQPVLAQPRVTPPPGDPPVAAVMLPGLVLLAVMLAVQGMRWSPRGQTGRLHFPATWRQARAPPFFAGPIAL
jgi:hypothetical protein